jgi:hypothetical protein
MAQRSPAKGKFVPEPQPLARRSGSGQASTRVILLAAGCFLLGAGSSALWLRAVAERGAATAPAAVKDQVPQELSESTKAILTRLSSPVEIRFYSFVEPGTASDSLRSFSARVDAVLKAYQDMAAGKLNVKHFGPEAYSAAGAATADGMKPIGGENGNPSFLGIAVVQGERQQTLPQLAPEWEVALEADLTRVIARVNQESSGGRPSAVLQTVSASAMAEEVRRIVPNWDSLSLEEGTRMLREAALKEFKDTATQLQTQLQQAEQALSQAQTNGSAVDMQSAMKRLQQLQSDQTERLKQIAADSQVQIEALRRLKTTGP